MANVSIFSKGTASQPQLIMLAVSGLFGLIVLIVSYYIVVNKFGTNSQRSALYTRRNDNSVSNAVVVPSPVPSQSSGASMPAPVGTSALLLGGKGSPATNAIVPSGGPKQVFNIRQNIFTKSEAPAVCALFGADVATIDQLQEAHSKGANWCNVGWTKDGLAAYPIQQSTWEKLQENMDPEKRRQCGVPGINLVNNADNMMYGVNCYGVKPVPRGDEKLKQTTMTDADLLKQATMEKLRGKIDSINIVPFNEDTWCYGDSTASN